MLFRSFKALQEGQTSVQIEESDLRDDKNAQIPHADEGAVLFIMPEISVEESSWGRLKSIFK